MFSFQLGNTDSFVRFLKANKRRNFFHLIDCLFRAMFDLTICYIRCKLFYMKDKEFADKGLGMLHLKPVADSKKTQLLVRAETSLGNILFNIMLNKQVKFYFKFANELQKLSRRAFFDCEKCIPNKITSSLTPPTHPTNTHEFIGAYIIQILPLGDPAFPRMIKFVFKEY